MLFSCSKKKAHWTSINLSFNSVKEFKNIYCILNLAEIRDLYLPLQGVVIDVENIFRF